MLRILQERPETRYTTDVFWEKEGREVFDTTLWSLPNFLGILHTAGASGGKEAVERVQSKAAENLRTFLTKGETANRVDVAEYVGRERLDSWPSFGSGNLASSTPVSSGC